nr:HlyD family efflux transporter periplasmic adaptor subunit [uncultured Chitinophaga sp.]
MQEQINTIHDTGRMPAPERITPADITRHISTGDTSPEFEEILERTPSWIMRWGMLSFLLIFLLLFSIAAFIKYPDTLEGKVVITTAPLPVRIKALAGGRILQVTGKEGDAVNSGQILAEMENNTGLSNIRLLDSLCSRIRQALSGKDFPALAAISAHELVSLGDAQDHYNKLLESTSALLLLKNQAIYSKRIGVLQSQKSHYRDMAAIADQNRLLTDETLKREEEMLSAYKSLFDDKVISKKEYQEALDQYTLKKKEWQNQRSARLQSAISENENNKLLADVAFEQAEKVQSLLLTIDEQARNLQNFIQGWKLKYLLVAPYNGVVHELRSVQANDVLTAGEEVYMITPEKSSFIASALFPSTNFGKIGKGQQAHILLDQFPYNEYGYLEGKVTFISSTPQAAATGKQGADQQPQYRVYVQLGDSLVSSYQRRLAFTPEMNGTIRIITRDKNLLQRLMESVWKINK